MVEKELLEVQLAQQQPFDTTFKALLEDQTKAFIDGVEYLHELSDTALKPSLRVDRVYLIRYQGELHVLHIEFETDANSTMPLRMLEYYGILHRKYRMTIIPLVICPFRTMIPDPPLRIMSREEEILIFHYRVIKLWTYKARYYLEKHMVSIYALLPTMEDANYTTLKDALDEMKEWYNNESKRFSTHLLWFGTCLKRTDTVSPEDKRRVFKKMEDFGTLLDENPFVQKRRAEGKAEGLAEGLQDALVTVVEARFPPLVELVQQKIVHITKHDTLNLLIKGIATAPDEAAVRWLLETLAA